ncbi:hypothetical protein EB796_001978 [Bugula neritina]|uniref:Uncharacterized protein n=1 Tax=Bugula neritina TaxID=10212 RepID=A0A7J7KNJ1_BUGNE|nr:hypothetical protein EB796_001978 [Bugula neritina]
MYIHSSSCSIYQCIRDYYNFLEIQMALSSDDSTQSVLYFGDSSQIYKFDGSAIEEVMTNQELGTWSVRDDQLFTSSKFTNIATRGFDVNLWQLSNISNSTVIGALKGNFPTDMKIVETSRTGRCE